MDTTGKINQSNLRQTALSRAGSNELDGSLPKLLVERFSGSVIMESREVALSDIVLVGIPCGLRSRKRRNGNQGSLIFR